MSKLRNEANTFLGLNSITDSLAKLWLVPVMDEEFVEFRFHVLGVVL